MALEDITSDGEWISIEVLASVTAANGTPIASPTSGVAMSTIFDAFDANARGLPSDLSLVIVSTAGSGTMVCTAAHWMRAGLLAGLTNGAWVKSLVYGGASIAEATTDRICFAEPVSLLGHFDRYFLEIATIGGTSTAVTGFLRGRKGYGPGRL